MKTSKQTNELVSHHKSWQESFSKESKANTIEVDEVAAKVAAFYEKIRGVVDWREEHLLKKTAIERMLKRRLLLQKDGKEVGEGLMYELVRGGHFPNNQIPESIIKDIQNIIDKYVYIIYNAPANFHKYPIELDSWLHGIAASEIEEVLSSPQRELALIEFTTNHMEKRIDMSQDKTNQIYVAVQKALFNLDETTITQHLFFKLNPDWSNLSKERLDSITQNIYHTRKDIQNIFKHPLSERVYQYIEKYDTPYLILGDIIKKEPNAFDELSENPQELESAIKNAYDERLSKLKKKIKKAGIYSTLSIFISKIFIAVAIEVPIDKLLLDTVAYYSLALSVGIPSLLMLFLVLGTKPSSKENFQKVLMEVMKLVYEKDEIETYKITAPKKRKGIISLFVYASYFLSFIVSFGILIIGLTKANFTVPSIVIFLLFISLVAFAGTVIRQRSKELIIIKQSEGFLFGVFDIFFLPIVRAGKVLSRNLVKYNFVTMLFNVFLEIPFQIFIEFIEQWRAFLKEKKEEIH